MTGKIVVDVELQPPSIPAWPHPARRIYENSISSRKVWRRDVFLDTRKVMARRDRDTPALPGFTPSRLEYKRVHAKIW